MLRQVSCWQPLAALSGRKRMVWKSFGVQWMIDVPMGITHYSSVREVSHEDVELEDVSDSS